MLDISIKSKTTSQIVKEQSLNRLLTIRSEIKILTENLYF